MAKPTLIFMGTADFAVPSLEALVAAGYPVAAVVTAPDKPKGRGQRLLPSPVKTAALRLQLPLLQPVDLHDPTFHTTLRSYRPDLQVVVAFRLLPEAVFAFPPLGTLNLHAALLPQYRGAAPIQRALMAGETTTGLTTFSIDKGVDTGAILLQERMPIHSEDNFGTLYSRMQHAGAQLVVRTVAGLASGALKNQPQATSTGILIPRAPKILATDRLIDWHQPATTIHHQVRALSPRPGARTTFMGQSYKIGQAALLPASTSPLTPGAIDTDGTTYLHIGTGSTPLAIIQLQPAGKRPMAIADFLRGHGHRFATIYD